MIYTDYERGHKTLSETFQHQGVLPMTIHVGGNGILPLPKQSFSIGCVSKSERKNNPLYYPRTGPEV